MLSNINMYNYPDTGGLLGSQSPNVNSSDKIIRAEEAKVTAKTALENNGNLSLSTRAQKLSAITSEFFSGKPVASIDTAKLIDRVYEYGLISQKEYASLNDKPQGVDDAVVVEPTSTQSLSQFLDRFNERLSGIEGYQDSTDSTVVALKQALDHASIIFNDIEQAKKAPDFKSTLADTKETLTKLLNSEEFRAMPLDDKVDMSNVIKTLDVIDKISLKRLDNPMVNKYINIANY